MMMKRGSFWQSNENEFRRDESTMKRSLSNSFELRGANDQRNPLPASCNGHPVETNQSKSCSCSLSSPKSGATPSWYKAAARWCKTRDIAAKTARSNAQCWMQMLLGPSERQHEPCCSWLCTGVIALFCGSESVVHELIVTTRIDHATVHELLLA